MSVRHTILAAALSAPVPVAAQGVLPGEAFTSLTVATLSPPAPVTGADGRVHLASEIVIGNPGHLFMTVEKVEIVGPDGTALATLEGDALAAMTIAWTMVDGALPPGGLAVVLTDAALDPAAPLPATVAARVTASRRLAGKDGRPAPFPADAAVPATVTFTAGETPLGPPARVIDAPLRGPGWVVVNGCCDSATSHRAGAEVVNGALRFPETFAIDWMQIGPDGALFSGDGSKLGDYPFYGAPVYAVADGVVVDAFDGLDPQVPFARDPNLAPEVITGNTIVLDLGDGVYALYAHLLKGSFKVAEGERVTAGQQLAQLGNTGNSDGPHLHFQLMDTPSPLGARGLPFAIRRFGSAGVLKGGSDAAFEASMAGKPVAIDPRLSGAHAEALPLNDQVVSFE
ncbi:peptidoglycan DD-metalloendopeptidase family protein [Amaricoccus sp.]|uniref:M23 family metallopeptidase n=1 Tax=Amaricoccus sp. TaxID=1872485 RepID=UPI001B6FB564|nr:peptidoglycan DD-metalloendopeptidase family protein [Amaricoccus sp.]MBP7241354.1 peptidoglycan DD-metalloendopeptidase family protein [Amaricoccus sp.]